MRLCCDTASLLSLHFLFAFLQPLLQYLILRGPDPSSRSQSQSHCHHYRTSFRCFQTDLNRSQHTTELEFSWAFACPKRSTCWLWVFSENMIGKCYFIVLSETLKMTSQEGTDRLYLLTDERRRTSLTNFFGFPLLKLFWNVLLKIKAIVILLKANQW